MTYAEISASPALRSLVECYWMISGPSGAGRVLPDGCIDVLLIGDAQRAEVVGTMTRAIIGPPSSRGVVGIRFRPGEAARLFPDAPRDLTDRDALLSDMWSNGSELEDTLAEVLVPKAQTNALAQIGSRLDAILARSLARGAGPVDLHVRTATHTLAANGSVRAAAQAVGLSERQLARRFERRVGIAPKTFGRVMRLQRAAGALAEGLTAATAAALAGYADQAHFTRDASALAGVTPRVLAQELRARREVSDSSKTTGTAAA